MAKLDPPAPMFPVSELIRQAPKVLGVSAEAAVGALSGCTAPMTIQTARTTVTAWLHQGVN